MTATATDTHDRPAAAARATARRYLPDGMGPDRITAAVADPVLEGRFGRV